MQIRQSEVYEEMKKLRKVITDLTDSVATLTEIVVSGNVSVGADLDVTGDTTIAGTTVLSDSLTTAGLVLGVSTHAYADTTAWTLSTAEAKATILPATGTSGGACDVVAVPTAGKLFIVSNATGSALTIKASGQTGVSIANAKTAIVRGNGTDFVEVVSLA